MGSVTQARQKLAALDERVTEVEAGKVTLDAFSDLHRSGVITDLPENHYLISKTGTGMTAAEICAASYTSGRHYTSGGYESIKAAIYDGGLWYKALFTKRTHTEVLVHKQYPTAGTVWTTVTSRRKYTSSYGMTVEATSAAGDKYVLSNAFGDTVSANGWASGDGMPQSITITLPVALKNARVFLYSRTSSAVSNPGGVQVYGDGSLMASASLSSVATGALLATLSLNNDVPVTTIKITITSTYNSTYSYVALGRVLVDGYQIVE